jgi:asparagine synthase (glutamine-hydrolysing)
MVRLREIISSKITEDEFEEKQQAYPVRFLNKEPLYYYEIYRKVIGKIPQPTGTENPCPGCGAGVEVDGFHCKVCGYVSRLEKRR